MNAPLVWVAGGRDYRNARVLRDNLAEYLEDIRYILIVGGAPGADTLAKSLWRREQRPYFVIPAEWKQKGKQAGTLRNWQIGNYRPELLVAFPGGRGTDHARSVAMQLGITIVRVYE